MTLDSLLAKFNPKGWDFRWMAPRFLLLFTLMIFVSMPLLGIYIDAEVGDSISLILVSGGACGFVGMFVGFTMCYWLYFSRVQWKAEDIVELHDYLGG